MSTSFTTRLLRVQTSFKLTLTQLAALLGTSPHQLLRTMRTGMPTRYQLTRLEKLEKLLDAMGPASPRSLQARLFASGDGVSLYERQEED